MSRFIVKKIKFFSIYEKQKNRKNFYHKTKKNHDKIKKMVLNSSIKKTKEGGKEMFKKEEYKQEKNRGITLIALIITILFSYDEKLKFSNGKGFLLQTI